MLSDLVRPLDAGHVIRKRVADVFSQVLGASSGEDQAEALKAVVTEENASTLASLVYFVDVDLARPGFDIPVARAILRAMHPGTRTLCRFIANQTEANYARAKIGAGGALLLAWDLQHGPASSSLESIVLSDNNLGKDGAVALAKALNVNASMKKMNVLSNSIGEEGYEMLTQVAEAKGIGSLCGLDEGQTESDLSSKTTGFYLQPIDAKLIAWELTTGYVSTSMTFLDLSSNELTGKKWDGYHWVSAGDMTGIKAIADALSVSS